jgi:hypothetical protein
VIGHLDLRGNNHPRPGFVPLTRLSAAGAFISPSTFLERIRLNSRAFVFTDPT